MPILSEVLASGGLLAELPCADGNSAPPLLSGFRDLDRLTGGLQGKVLLTGLPGRGRTTLAFQLALTAALAGRSVDVRAAREDGRAIVSRFVAATGSVPLHRLRRGSPLDGPTRSRVEAAQVRLRKADLRFDQGAHASPAGNVLDVLVVDDLHLFPAHSRPTWSPHPARLLVATVPQDLVCCGPIGLAPELRREWVEPFDLVIAIEWGHRRHTEGEVQLLVLRNRQGPTDTIAVAHQGPYARFVDLQEDVLHDEVD
jgi:replicative DNA helicase